VGESKRGGWKEALIALVWRNWITLFGASLTTVTFCTIVTFLLMGVAGIEQSPYVGILAFLILPGLFLVGLLLIPVGAYWGRRKRLRQSDSSRADEHLEIDFNSPRIRRMVVLVCALTVANLIVISTVSYKGAAYMETTEFCGQVCHVAMEPEYLAHMDSPHSQVACVKCHVGPGLPALMKAKLSGVRQVVGVATDHIERPIPAPVATMRAAEETCGECHDSGHDIGNPLRIKAEYSADETNTHLMTVLLMRVGGGDNPKGAHGWHLQPGREVYYFSSDEKREEIPYVRVMDSDGTETEYWADGIDPDSLDLSSVPMRRMDCIDCHNRPTHAFQMPESAVNEAISVGKIDPAIPYIKLATLEALQATDGEDADSDLIADQIRSFYQDEYAEIWSDHQQGIEHAITQTQSIYKRNVFPAMKVTWGTYPDHSGHTEFTGCFRCHDDAHISKKETAISQDCMVCHDVLAWQEEDPEILQQFAPL
jgi:hypothetical protein